MGLYKWKKDKKRRLQLNLLTITTLLILIIILLVVNGRINTENLKDPGCVKALNCTVVITIDYGEELVLTQQIQSNDSLSAFDALCRVATVGSNGGFVNSINNVTSTYSIFNEESKDWFYYINGVLSPVGSQAYMVHDGDVIHWDYHTWVDYKSSTVIIGDYPEPFLHGFNGKRPGSFIVYTSDFIDEAEEVRETLLSLYSVNSSLIPVNSLNNEVKTRGNLILIGTLDDHPLIKSIMDSSSMLGLFIRYKDNGIEILDELYRSTGYFDHGGCIIALQNHWNPKGSVHGENIIWIITGVTSSDVEKACDLLCYKADVIRYANSVVVIDDEVMRVP
jgi:hypothetical protein